MGKKARNQPRGQISIMIAMMMMTFIIFFAFVINTGMLVNAKINLQNAADMAAYAGAAVQARQLNQISFLNYEMRRQYKKFLFRYYVIGNMAKKSFPMSGGGSGKTPMTYSPDGTPANDYKVPVVCIIRNPKDNYCQVQKLPKIQIPQKTAMDQINNTLIEVLKKIEAARQEMCSGISGGNIILLKMWLYNTDPTYESLKSSGALSEKGQEVIRLLDQLALGLGLVPRELILRSRIGTLLTYFSDPATGVTKDTVDGLKQSPDAPSNERTIQAFLSAFYTLGEGTFPDSGSIMMDELQGSNQLVLNNIKVKFDTYAQDFDVTDATASQVDANGARDCAPKLIPETISTDLTVGVSKEPSVLTYYAIRLKADNPRLLFWPFGNVTLKAYSAARPFGSRLGPPYTAKDFLAAKTAGNIDLTSGAGASLAGHIPNLPVRISDTADSANGWDTQEVVYQMFKGFAAGPNGSIPSTISASDVDRAIQRAMAPNPIEGNVYNIINDLANDSFVLNFGTDHLAAFWAPVAKNGDFASQLDSIFGNGDNTGSGAANAQAIKGEFVRMLSAYMGKLTAGQGENGEGMNVVRISDPFVDNAGQVGMASSVSGPPELFLTSSSDKNLFRTSWAGVRKPSMKDSGRVGYSVKFVSFDSLIMTKTSPSGGGTTFNNGLILDDEASTDQADALKH